MSSSLEQRCLERGIRLTEQRRAIVRVLGQADDRPDVEEVYRRAARIDRQISLAAVYRTLRLFEEAGLVARHDLGDGRVLYEGLGARAATAAETPARPPWTAARHDRPDDRLYAAPNDAGRPGTGERPRL